MAFSWGHTFTTPDECLRKDTALPFIRAINERLSALGAIPLTEDISGLVALKGSLRLPHIQPTAAGADDIVSPAGVYTITSISGSTLKTTASASVNWTISEPGWTPVVGGSALCQAGRAYSTTFLQTNVSWKTLQQLCFNMAAMTDIGFLIFGKASLSGGVLTVQNPMHKVGSPVEWDYAGWPYPNGFTRKREPEITALSWSTGFADGDRARFRFSTGTYFCEFLATTMPATSSSERQYSGKIMKRVSGAWTVDTDQATRISPLWSLKGVWAEGDIFGPWCLNDLTTAIRDLDTLTASSAYILTDRYTKTGNYSSGFDTYAHAAGQVETNWTAAAEVGPDTSGALPGAQLYRIIGASDPGSFTNSITTFRGRVNRGGFQGSRGPLDNFDAGSRHSMSSDVDIYIHSTLAATAVTSRTETYESVGGLIQDQWVKWQTLGITNTDVRTSTYLGDNLSFPTRPSLPVSPANTHDTGYNTDQFPWTVQRFGVAGGFTYT